MPRNFRDALDELNQTADPEGADLSTRLQQEVAKLEAKLRELQPQLDEIKNKVQNEAARTKARVETQVKENPWTSLGVVGLVFLIVGFLLGSRRSD